ncbi:type VI secretion system-associated FHA domain protein TagH [Azoarcus olearius]|uniref:Hypothetical regulatory protein n=1 Tax=Azoarcus sp. (strain BH72) TaxID=418699 RepID=A1KCE4_AZOSB|nr:type VI secretion system-associated FHA domain protein TagH [Azoarcus olearius]CAL96500.1 hypothetical regulatory protein [Azoarcus olearius]
MLRISVIQVNGFPPATPLAGEFDERGGTIGRDDSNALTLPDPGRHISRMQAQVQYDGSRYVLTDHGGNPTHLNGRPLGKGASATLRDGDEIGIADYTLRVEIVRTVSGFGNETLPNIEQRGDPLGLDLDLALPPDLPAGLGAPAAAAPPPRAAALDDDPFAVFAAATPTPPAPPAAAPPAASVSDDPFAAFAPARPAPPPAPASSRAGDPLGIGALAQPAEASSLDALFGLDGASTGGDPFAGSPLGNPAHAPAPFDGGGEDPLALLGGMAATPSSAPVRNDSPLLNDAFAPPRLIDDSPPRPLAPAPASAAAPAPQRSPAAPQGGVVSWASTPAAPAAPAAPAVPAAGDDGREAPTRIVPAFPPPEAPRANVGIERAPLTPAPAPAPSPVPPASAPAAAAQPAAASAGSSADADALLAAFARGIGLPRLAPAGGLTPELMEHIGRMLREAVQGTVELLVARAATKREVRADVTMIVSKNNNPLKFSPDVDFALMQLLLPQGSGFMKPDEAMQDAYDDLRAHQLGFMAGMRAALASILGRFTPAELEARLTTKSFLDNVLPANRKAKLWDLYEQRYGDISREAEDDFHSLFGREFLKAYEAQIDQLQRERG